MSRGHHYSRRGAIVPILARPHFEPWRSHPELVAKVAANVPERQLRRHENLNKFVLEWEDWNFSNALDPLPIDHGILYGYFDQLHKLEGLNYPSLRFGYSAINSYQLTNSFTPISSELMSCFLRNASCKWIVSKATVLLPDQIYAMCDLAFAIEPPLIAQRNVSLILLAYDSSVRPGAARKIHYEHLHWPKRHRGFTFTFVNYKKYQPTLETVPVGVTRFGRYSTIEELQKWLTLSCITSGPIFPGFENGSLRDEPISDQSFRDMISQYATMLGFEGHFTGYSTRRGSATAMHEYGWTDAEIGDRLGQDSIHITRGYIDRSANSWSRIPRSLP